MAENRQVVRGTIERSGVDRCMLGSNLPVDSPCASFEDLFSGGIRPTVLKNFPTEVRRAF